MKRTVENGHLKEFQTQCLAMGDGVDYEKYANGIRAQKLESAMANKRILYILGAAVLAVLAVCLFVGHGLVGF